MGSRLGGNVGMVYRASDRNGGQVRTVSLTNYIATVSVFVAVIAFMAGSMFERSALIRGLVTDSELNTMAAGLKQGIDAALDDLDAHKGLQWHAGAGARHAESKSDRASIHRELDHLTRTVEKHHND